MITFQKLEIFKNTLLAFDFVWKYTIPMHNREGIRGIFHGQNKFGQILWDIEK